MPCFPTNVPLDYVHIEGMTAQKLRPYRLVYFPYPLMMPAAAAAELREYVRQGGTLVAEARLGWNDERGRSSDTLPGMGMHEVFGCREEQVQTGKEGRTELKWEGDVIPGLKPGEMIPARWYEETLALVGGNSKVVARFADGRPAAVLASFGSGKAMMLGSYVSAAYASKPSEVSRRFFAGLLKWAGVQPAVGISGGDVEVQVMETGKGRLVFAFNHAKEAVSLEIKLAPGTTKARDLVTDAAVPVKVHTVSSPLAPGQVWILHVQ